MTLLKKSGFFLATAVCLDLVATGGVVSLASLGISSICQSLSKVGSDVFSGLLSHYLIIDQESGKSQNGVNKAFKKSVEQTLQDVRKELISDESLEVSWWRKHMLEWGMDIPSHEENFTILKSIDRHFLLPLINLLNDDNLLNEILGRNQELKAGELIEKLISNKKISLPEFRHEYQERVSSAVIDGFKKRFMFYFVENITKNEKVREFYQTRLLQTSVHHLVSVQQGLDNLLHHAEFFKIALDDTTSLLKESIQNQRTDFQKVLSKFHNQYSLKLVAYHSVKGDIRDQFRFDSLYTTFQGRTHALETLFSFLSNEKTFCFYAITGPGGSGKSRLANELCLRAEKILWISGFSDHNKNRYFRWDSFEPIAPTLIVLDYIIGRKEEVSSIIEILSSLSQQKKFAYKVRLLLLERYIDKDLKKLLFTSKTRENYYTYAQNEEEQPYQLTGLSLDDRWGIIEQVVNESTDEILVDQIKRNKESIIAQLDIQDPEKRPLFTFFSAVALKEGADINGWNTNNNLQYHLDRIQSKIWSQVDVWNKEGTRTPLKNLIWLAAICESISHNDLNKIVNLPPFKKLSDYTNNEDLYEQLYVLFKMDGGSLEADFPGIKPDLLAEFFIVSHIEAMQKIPALEAQLKELYQIAWETNPEAAAWMTFLTFSNFYTGYDTSAISHYFNWMSETNQLNQEYYGGLFFDLANLFREKIMLDDSERFYLEAIESGVIVAYNNLGSVYSLKDDFDQAESCYRKAIVNGDVMGFFNLGVLYEDNGRLNEAKDSYLKAISWGDREACVNLGLLYQKGGQINDSKNCFEEAIARGDTNSFLWLGYIYLNEGDLVKSKDLFLKGVENQVVNALTALAKVFAIEDDFNNAEKYYLKAIGRSEQIAYIYLGDLYLRQNMENEAEIYYMMAIENGIDQGLASLAQLYRRQKRWSDAKIYFLRSIDAGNVDSITNLGNAYREQGKLQAAETCYLEAIGKGSENAANNLGSLYLKMGRTTEAEDYIKMAIEAGNAFAYVNLGILQLDQGRYEEAEQSLLKADQNGVREANRLLSQLYNNQGKYDLAQQFMTNYINSK